MSRSTLSSFWQDHPQAEGPLRAWFTEAEKATWRGPQDIKRRFASASFLVNDRVVFNVGGNTYRLVVHVRYHAFAVYIRFVGTHAEYDKIDASTV